MNIIHVRTCGLSWFSFVSHLITCWKFGSVVKNFQILGGPTIFKDAPCAHGTHAFAMKFCRKPLKVVLETRNHQNFEKKQEWKMSRRNEPPRDKTNKVSVHPAKTQISLGISPVWSESSLSAWRKLGLLATHWAHSEDSDQTGRMPRLIWVFAGRTATLLVLSRGSSNNDNDVGTLAMLKYRCNEKMTFCVL